MLQQPEHSAAKNVAIVYLPAPGLIFCLSPLKVKRATGLATLVEYDAHPGVGILNTVIVATYNPHRQAGSPSEDAEAAHCSFRFLHATPLIIIPNTTRLVERAPRSLGSVSIQLFNVSIVQSRGRRSSDHGKDQSG
ncbi:hypothetical protein J1614_004305 [Plenodomus biglobosus]|nr:hypothetical protein J1614_004305 [Plenodomus biglobosus]